MANPLNVCLVGYGMMGTWHSEALKQSDCCLHTIVGRRQPQTDEFKKRYGFQKATTSFADALADPAIDVVILANPSEAHAETALASLAKGKHTLVEIPLAMNLADAEKIVASAQARDLILGVVHPLRMRTEMQALRARVQAGVESIRQIVGRFYIHRLENVGATGYVRSWTDNLLWHHTTHLLDFGLWMLDQPVRRVHSFMPTLDAQTGIPMEVFIGVETNTDQSLVCTGSYYGRERIFDTLVVTNRDSYRLDVFTSTLTTGAGTQAVEREQANCERVTRDFIEAVKAQRQPAIPGQSVLPAMRVLQTVQDEWDQTYGAQSIPGRQRA